MIADALALWVAKASIGMVLIMGDKQVSDFHGEGIHLKTEKLHKMEI